LQTQQLGLQTQQLGLQTQQLGLPPQHGQLHGMQAFVPVQGYAAFEPRVQGLSHMGKSRSGSRSGLVGSASFRTEDSEGSSDVASPGTKRIKRGKAKDSDKEKSNKGR
jgi:hypothetical protein